MHVLVLNFDDKSPTSKAFIMQLSTHCPFYISDDVGNAISLFICLIGFEQNAHFSSVLYKA